MKTKLLIILSLGLNVGLLCALLVSKSSPSPAVGEPSVMVAGEKAGAAPAPAMAAGQKAGSTFDWRAVESADYRKYIANLRSIGCPEETIRDIITADVNKLFLSRRKELLATVGKFQYWKAEAGMTGGLGGEQMDKLRALNQERRNVLRDLLGVDVGEDPAFVAALSPGNGMLDFLPTDKQKQIQDIYDKFQAKFAKAVNGGMVSDEAMRQVQKEMDAELTASMSPEEYREYQLRMSPTAVGMRAQLAGFDPTEDEFNRIFDIKKKYDDQFAAANLGATATKEDRDKLAAEQKQMIDQFKAVLGEQRYAEYERSQDWNYQALLQVADQYGLAKDSAGKIYDMKKMAEAQANAIRKDKSLASEERTAALALIRSETEGSIQKVLGDKAWPSYQNQAYWLNGLASKSAPDKQQERVSGVIVLP